MLFFVSPSFCSIFFFNDTATTEIYTLSLHDALPISSNSEERAVRKPFFVTIARYEPVATDSKRACPSDRKSTRLNSSHANISYAVFCLKKKKKNQHTLTTEYGDSNTHK